jgi:hypothetical protein
MKSMRLRFINDPHHAWLAVPLTAIYARKLEGAISWHSYMDAPKGHAYLDEDADAPLFLAEIHKEGIDPSFEDIFYEDDCFVRKLPRFRPRPWLF